MTDEMDTLSDNRGDTPTEILKATCRVLAREGSLGLTTQKIADECEMSQGVVHYHYNTKEELFLAVIDHLFQQRIDTLERLPEGDVLDRLDAFFDCVLGDLDESGYRLAVVELAIHAQAPHNATVQSQLERYGRRSELLAGIIEDGIDREIFRPVDTERTVAAVLSMVDGARFRAVAFDTEESVTHARETLDGFVCAQLLSESR